MGLSYRYNFYGFMSIYSLILGFLGDAMINVYYNDYEHLWLDSFGRLSSEDNIHVKVSWANF